MADDGKTRRDEAGGEEDLKARFPDPDSDDRLRVPRGGDLPEVPRTDFKRPTLPEARPNRRIEEMAGGMRGAGAASVIGINLVVCIFIGTGLGWLVDKYLLGSPATPWGLIVGFLLGTISGFVQVVRTANQLNKD